MKMAETRYVSAFSTKTTAIPNAAVAKPPMAIPSVKMILHESVEITFAVTSSSRLVILGIDEDLAGSNMAAIII